MYLQALNSGHFAISGVSQFPSWISTYLLRGIVFSPSCCCLWAVLIWTSSGLAATFAFNVLPAWHEEQPKRPKSRCCDCTGLDLHREPTKLAMLAAKIKKEFQSPEIPLQRYYPLCAPPLQCQSSHR